MNGDHYWVICLPDLEELVATVNRMRTTDGWKPQGGSATVGSPRDGIRYLQAMVRP